MEHLMQLPVVTFLGMAAIFGATLVTISLLDLRSQ